MNPNNNKKHPNRNQNDPNNFDDPYAASLIGMPPTLPFPLEVFPKVLQDYIQECSSTLNLIPDFMGMGVLSAVASLIGNSYRIQIKQGWTERPLLWLAIVGYSGIRKTPSLSAAISPLQKMDKGLYAQFCQAWQDYKQQINDGNTSITKPTPKQLLVTDATIEALIPILKNNPNGLLYFKDELMAWINDLTRYNRGSAEQQWLSIYSSQAIRLNRKNEEDNYRVDHPFANVLGGLQPDILPNLFENDRGINGFTSRIAFAYPEPIQRKVSKGNMSRKTQADYELFLERFTGIEKRESNGQIEPITLIFSSEAQERFYEWDETFINQKINDSNLPESIKSALSKMEALMPRLALVLQFMENISKSIKEPQTVSLEATNNAIKLTDYFYNHLQKVLRKVTPMKLAAEQRELLLLKNFCFDILSGLSKEMVVQRLLEQGYSNSEISRALSIAKSTITYWTKK